MLGGPELARLVNEFDEDNSFNDELMHHDHGLSHQMKFQRDVISLVKAIKEMGNPFLDDFPELITMDEREPVDEDIIEAIKNLEQIGKDAKETFINSVFKEKTKSVHDPIKRNALPLFSKTPKQQSKEKEKCAREQQYASRFGELYISVQTRGGNLTEFFSEEQNKFPISLSESGKLYMPSTKSDLMKDCIKPNDVKVPPTMDCIVVDLALIVHLLGSGSERTFDDYVYKRLIPYLLGMLKYADELHVIADRYIPSIKDCTREERGKGKRKKVSSKATLPANWEGFLNNSENKRELFPFVGNTLSSYTWPEGKKLYITIGKMPY